jgi:hypothetical protein
VNKRQQINAEILKQLEAANSALPDQRFSQLLVNAGITHDVSKNLEGWQAPVHMVFYNEESEVTLKRLLETLEDLYAKMLEGSDVDREEV